MTGMRIRQCPRCGLRFTSSSELEDHLAQDHRPRQTTAPDFTNPHSYLASRRVDTLRAAGVAVDWRAVESRPYLPVTGQRDAARLADLARQHDEVARLLVDGEELPGGRPGFVANTQAAVSAYAEAYGAGVADDVRRLLFALYWEDGVDIGNPNALPTSLPHQSCAAARCPTPYAGSAMP